MIRAWAANFSGEMVWLIIKNPTRLQPELTGQPEMLDRHIGLGAVRGDPADLTTIVLRLLDVLLGPHPGSIKKAILAFFARLARRA